MNAIGNGLRGMWYGLFYETTPEGGKKFSAGRLILYILISVAIKIWTGGADIPVTMLTFVMMQSGYVFGTKMLNSIEKVKSIIKK